MFLELRATLATLLILGRSQWRSRWGRSVLTMLSIAIAVTTIVGVWISGDATQAAYQALAEEVEGPPAVELAAEEETANLTPQEIAQATKLPGVQHVLPRLVRGANVRFRGQKAKTLVAGIDPQQEAETKFYQLTAGRFCQDEKETLVQESLAKALGLNLDDEFSVWATGFSRLTIVGTFKTEQLQEPPAPILVTLAQAQEMFKEPERIDLYRLTVSDAAARERLLADLPPLLPAGWQARKPISHGQLPDDIIQSAELGLKFASAMAAIMAAIVVFNTFLMNVSERRRQFAVLRTIGASDTQVLGLVQGEAAILGLLGTLLGIFAGWGLAVVITAAMSLALETNLPTPQLSPLAVILGGMAGPFLAMAGAYFPSREVCRISPLEGLAHIEPAPEKSAHWRVALVALAAWGIGFTMLALVQINQIDKLFIVPAGTFAFAGLLLLTPLLVNRLVRWIAWLVPSRPTVRRLCNEQLLRRRMRTALTLSVLIVAIGNGLGVGNVIQSNIEDVRSWFRRLFSSDFIVAPMLPAKGADDTELRKQISAVSGVASLASLRIFSSRIATKPVMFIARDHLPEIPLPYQLHQGTAAQLRESLQAGGIIIASGFARRSGLKLGDRCEIEIEGGTIPAFVAGVTNDYMYGGNVAYAELATLQAQLPVGGADVLFVYADQSPGLAERLRTFADDHQLTLSDQRIERQTVERIMSGVVGALWSLLLIGFLVGGFAVANTLSGNILEQTREFGLLRVIGMTSAQAQRLCLRQALLLGIASLCIGVPIGLVMAAVVSYSNEILLGRPVPFQWHGGLLVGNIVAVILVVLLAGWFPARRITRLDLTDALSYE